MADLWNGTDSYNSVPASFSEVMNPKKTVIILMATIQGMERSWI